MRILHTAANLIHLTTLTTITVARPGQRYIEHENDYTELEEMKNVFGGIGTFAHLPHVQCVKNASAEFDIAFFGFPFDTGWLRPGARFGPTGIREGSRRRTLVGGYNIPQAVNPLDNWATVVDCGDAFITPYDNAAALSQMQRAYERVLYRSPVDLSRGKYLRIISLGGDHTITLPILRALKSNHCLIAAAPLLISTTVLIFYHASQEGLLVKGASVHGGIRTKLISLKDYEDDEEFGFRVIEARIIDDIGTKGIIEKIRQIVGDNLVYLSIDIDTLDPAFAPATGTPETGGWNTRGFRTILQGLEGLKLIGADLVEVSPAYDTNAQVTSLAAADILFEVLSLMVRDPVYAN
ncbi:hypothetical protein VTP01DRAFT_4114 [Rhizomucor pusillus]|uniref:uncharacterized protein n=1 Tax=Rhizomucor pusillus TaxID=4840 RepID=UPI003743138B